MSEFRARLLGVMLVAGGIALGWFFGIRPLQEAQTGAPAVTYWIKTFIAAPMAVVCGLFLLIGGSRVAHVVMQPPRTRQQHLIVWPMFALALAAGGLAWWWFDSQLKALGYA